MLIHDKTYETYRDRISVLDNGVTIATRTLNPVHYPSSRSLFGVTVAAGALDEKPTPHGLAHFVEHTLFGEALRERWSEFLGARGYKGMNPNAVTSEDNTVYSLGGYEGTVSAKSDLLDMLTLQMDNLLNPDFSPENIENERRRILLELSGQSDISYQQRKEFIANIFPHRPLDLIIGDRSSIESITRQELQGFYKEHYVGKKLIVIIVYPAAANPADETVTHEIIVDKVGQYFSHLAAGTKPKAHPSAVFHDSETRLPQLIKPGSSDLDLCFAYPNPFPKAAQREIFVEFLTRQLLRDALDKDIYAKGLSYHWYPQMYWGGLDYIGFHFTVDRVKAATLIDLFALHLRNLALEDNGTLERMLNDTKRSSLKWNEINPPKPDAAFTELLFGMLYKNGQPGHPDDYARTIQSITVEEIRDYARRVVHGPIAMRVDGDMEGRYVEPLESFLHKLRDGVPQRAANSFPAPSVTPRRTQPLI